MVAPIVTVPARGISVRSIVIFTLFSLPMQPAVSEVDGGHNDPHHRYSSHTNPARQFTVAPAVTRTRAKAETCTSGSRPSGNWT